MFLIVLMLRGRVSSLVFQGSFSSTLLGRRSVRCFSTGAKRCLVPIADGSEEIETTCITDTLVRAGAQVVVASANADGSTTVTMSRGIKIATDVHIDAVEGEWDLVAVPGGMPGASNLAASSKLTSILTAQAEKNKNLGAVCASPAIVLEPLGILQNKQATCYPAPKFIDAIGTKFTQGDVVVDANIVTSRGPGTSLKFALALVEKLYGPEKSNELAKQMLVENYDD
mmetsp:Transcript_15375/g.18870  ORF Transcript_15375/g.18870 Transcript_15375/m.18870 type:complete len:227 (+) Transcript_15375:24-704(+)